MRFRFVGYLPKKVARATGANVCRRLLELGPYCVVEVLGAAEARGRSA